MADRDKNSNLKLSTSQLLKLGAGLSPLSNWLCCADRIGACTSSPAAGNELQREVSRIQQTCDISALESESAGRIISSRKPGCGMEPAFVLQITDAIGTSLLAGNALTGSALAELSSLWIMATRVADSCLGLLCTNTDYIHYWKRSEHSNTFRVFSACTACTLQIPDCSLLPMRKQIVALVDALCLSPATDTKLSPSRASTTLTATVQPHIKAANGKRVSGTGRRATCPSRSNIRGETRCGKGKSS